ncbi:hypothetical protein KIL84_018532 [Mauremys mutica]|uniref:Uncharacterized protein n=1 Tax=Mauremys mutica TaxID=74926 RepID=A0A9D3XUU9_9SAUR|nr:hypothetical protein KIL84_018532 [Mauremys mutica]
MCLVVKWNLTDSKSPSSKTQPCSAVFWGYWPITLEYFLEGSIWNYCHMFVGLLKHSSVQDAMSCYLGESLLCNGECKSDFFADLAYAAPTALAAHAKDRSLELREMFLGIYL